MKAYLLYAGLDKKDFDALTPKAQKVNQKRLRTYSLLAALVFAGLFIASGVITSFADVNQVLYGILMLLNTALFLCVVYVLPGCPAMLLPLAYLFMGGLYAFSLAVTGLHTEYPSTTTMVLLFTGPFFLYDRPIRMNIMTIAVTAAVCLVAYYCKDEELAHVDYWNGISFCTVAIVLETLQQQNNYRLLYREREVEYLSQTDILTGAKNRNHYENMLKKYPERCTSGLACIYVDVNGLHEMNNDHGHAAGDRLLTTAAGTFIKAFGAEHTYRIGGDEFVCFGVDIGEEEAQRRMKKIEEELAARDYSISWGAAAAEKSKIRMDSLTHDAEVEMYEAKNAYYQKIGYTR